MIFAAQVNIPHTHLGCNTPSCEIVSSGGSGGVFHSRSQCGTESKLCYRGIRTPNTV